MSAADRWLTSVCGPDRSWAAICAHTQLPREDQKEIEERLKQGLRDPRPAVRSLAWRTAEDGVVAAWATEGETSAHLALEVACAHERAREPLPEGAAVPGCSCWLCTGVAPGSQHDPDLGTVVCPRCFRYRELVRDTRERVFYLCPECGTRSAVSWSKIEVGSLWDDLVRVLPRQPRPEPRFEDRPLDVDAARRVPILDVARRLGIEIDPKLKTWALCPFHGDSRPSLHLNPKKNSAFCNPCHRRWDPIALVMEYRGIAFVEAVKELAA